MPIYEYQCKACGAELEKLQRLSDDPLVDCPACGQPELKKKISAARFRLSGSGWYETDFKKGSDKKKNLAGGSSGSDKDRTSDTSAGKTDTAKSAEKLANKGSKTDIKTPKKDSKP